MTASGSLHRKGSSGPKAVKSSQTVGATIRVSVPVSPITPKQAAPEANRKAEPAMGLGLPCTGRCGHCNNHPCLLHAAI